MSSSEDPRQRLKQRLSRTVVYTAPLMIAVTGAAGLHAIVNDLRGGLELQRSPATSTPDTAPQSVPEGMPEAAPEAMPEAAPEAMPEATPEATPEAVPEAGR